MSWWPKRRTQPAPEGGVGPLPVVSARPSDDWPPVDLLHLHQWVVMVAPRSSRLLEAVGVASGLVSSAPANELFRVDYQLRRLDAWDSSGWSGWRAKDLAGLVDVTGDPLAVASLMSMHRDGWLREASVELLSQQQTGAELRWLLLRCVDWVPQVRELAQAAVRARAVNPSGEYIDRLVRDAPLLLSERFKALQGDTTLPGDIEAGLRSDDAHPSSHRGLYRLRHPWARQNNQSSGIRPTADATSRPLPPSTRKRRQPRRHRHLSARRRVDRRDPRRRIRRCHL